MFLILNNVGNANLLTSFANLLSSQSWDSKPWGAKVDWDLIQNTKNNNTFVSKTSQDYLELMSTSTTKKFPCRTGTSTRLPSQ